MESLLTFDKKRIDLLRESYEKAHRDGKDTFVFDNNELDVRYAKFMLEFLDIQTKSMGGKK
tara:strand:+ start:390 stop:572 length:183 start_codon:yes stop_codon:yes gene_type:complete